MISLNWFGNVLVVWWLLQSIASIALIGQRRDPLTPGSAIFSCALHGTFLWCLLTIGTQHA